MTLYQYINIVNKLFEKNRTAGVYQKNIKEQEFILFTLSTVNIMMKIKQGHSRRVTLLETSLLILLSLLAQTLVLLNK